MTACLSWPVLERWSLGELTDAAVGQHLEGCAACRAALQSISDDARALPALPPVEARRPWAWWWAVAPVAAAAAVVLLVARPREPTRTKGGELAVELVRERGGAISLAPEDFAAGDRFKARVTCAGDAAVAELVVWQGEAASTPLPAASIACGNQVTLEGAFTITGAGPARVCVRLVGREEEPACVTLRAAAP